MTCQVPSAAAWGTAGFLSLGWARISDLPLTVSSVPPEDRHDLRMLAPFGPREGRGPGFIIGKVRGGAAGEEKLHHLHGICACCPGEWRRAVLVIAR